MSDIGRIKGEKPSTWEAKIDNLVRLAKAIGSYLEVEVEEPGSDGHKDARRRVKDAYYQFCEWRHDEPYVVDEIRALIQKAPDQRAQLRKDLASAGDRRDWDEVDRIEKKLLD